MMPATAARRPIEAPPTNPEIQPFWDAAARGELLVKGCRACERVHYYPRSICPLCFSAETYWKATAGTGTVYAHSVMRRVPVPYALAYVTLDEGVTMLTNLVDCDLDAVRIGDRVRVVFVETPDGPPVPMFTPIESLEPAESGT